jgi:hypothetical protein
MPHLIHGDFHMAASPYQPHHDVVAFSLMFARAPLGDNPVRTERSRDGIEHESGQICYWLEGLKALGYLACDRDWEGNRSTRILVYRGRASVWRGRYGGLSGKIDEAGSLSRPDAQSLGE